MNFKPTMHEPPSDTKSWASVSLFIEDPLSEWAASCPGATPSDSLLEKNH